MKKHRDNRSGSKAEDGQESKRSTGKPGQRWKSDAKEGRFGKDGNKSREFKRDQPEAYGKASGGRFSKRTSEESTGTGRNSAKPRRFEEREGGKSGSTKRPIKPFDKSAFNRKRSSPAEGKMATPPAYDMSRLKEKEEKVSAEAKLIRLNRYIANAGVCSRREADKLIEEGKIKVNGKVVAELGFKVSNTDSVEYEGTRLSREKLVYVLLNKPKDFITTTDDPQQRRTVMDLVATACEERIYPVGRLDRNTTGLLLLTNDGNLSERLAHPSHKVKKIYQVGLDKPISEEDFEKILAGVELEDGSVHVDAIEILTDDRNYLGVEIHVGRNRIVRRLFEHFGYEVIQLDRVMYAGLTKKDLPRGKWRYLSQKELIRLKHFG